MSVKIKVCGLKDRDNILEVLKLGPDYLGFILVKESKRYIEKDLLLKLLKDGEVLKRAVLVTRDMPLEDLRTLPLIFIKGIQLHGMETASYVKELRGEFPNLLIIKAIGVSSAESFSVCSEYVDQVDYFLFDTEIKSGDNKISGGTGQMFSWELLSEYHLNCPYFLSGGLSPDSMTLINKLCDKDSRLAGVDLNSRYELAPGLKDVVLLQESFNILRG